jgi:hypothetical protein
MVNGTKYTYNFLHVSKHPTPFPPEDEVEEVDNLCFVETLRDPLLLTVKFRQPSHEFTFSVGMTFVSYPLVLTPVV